MRLPFGLELSRGRKSATTLTIEQLQQRLEAVFQTHSEVVVTPENCMESPTVHAIVTAISNRISTLPVHVLQKTARNNREVKERQPNHPVAKLLNRPNERQTGPNYWLDSTSALVRYANAYAYKARGMTGPIRRLDWIEPWRVEIEQQDDMSLLYHVTQQGGGRVTYEASEIHHARGRARNGFKGDSPVWDVREAIAMEIAAERMGAAVFGNNAVPGIIFEFLDGFQGYKTDEERKSFIEDFHRAYSGRGRLKAALLPKGIKIGTQVAVENDKAQYVTSRQYQRTVIAGAFGVPPHMVGDLSKGTFNNVEQQSIAFVRDVVLPYCRLFEAAMERDLLTDEDRRAGIIVRFNLDASLRGDFKSQQEGLAIQRQNGVINANEWREHLGMNPRDDEGGDAFYEQGPSGQQPGGTGDDPQSETDDEDEDDEESSQRRA